MQIGLEVLDFHKRPNFTQTEELCLACYKIQTSLLTEKIFFTCPRMHVFIIWAPEKTRTLLVREAPTTNNRPILNFVRHHKISNQFVSENCCFVFDRRQHRQRRQRRRHRRHLLLLLAALN